MKGKNYRKSWLCRTQGLVGILLGGMFSKAGLDAKEGFLLAGGLIFIVDGLGDVITGYHHYFIEKVHEKSKQIIKNYRK